MGDWVGLNEVASLKSGKGKYQLSYVVNAIKFEPITCTYLLVSSSLAFPIFFGMRTNISQGKNTISSQTFEEYCHLQSQSKRYPF